ncbi:acyltransferase [Stieleria varia]|uniref:2,3,4,5-tetrahydropyridine-2,6-dicarboxylate N-acetyltransferase n=1 Tax=Stieleria varia TaxID=2528005 RepID=A0A5C6AHI1_9BACT|nr:acyltransferase [Stieleria varia]TWT98635.1 2,3,4,5-tetrahydropyridine-2,6-dicarboxylate N-acetyltransferase [Stieleria varia]
MIGRMVQVVNRMRARQVRRYLERNGIDLSHVQCSHRLLVKRESGVPTGETFRIGEHTHLEGRYILGSEGRIVIGSHCSFRTGTHMSSRDLITIGDHVFGAEGIFIADNDNHPVSPLARKEMTCTPPGSVLWKMSDQVACKPVAIEDGVWIGRHAMILKGVRIGQWSIVAAGAVVTKDVPEFSIVAGNPGKVVKTIVNDFELSGED